MTILCRTNLSIDYKPSLHGLVSLILSAAVSAQDAKLTADKRALLENTISKFMAANSVPGISAAVVWNGEEVWSEGFGMADLENSVPVTPQTLFRLASISKPITATAAMELWEQEKLDIKRPFRNIARPSRKKRRHQHAPADGASGRYSSLPTRSQGRH